MIRRIVVAVIILGGISAVTLKSLHPKPKEPVEISLAEAKKERVVRTVSGAGHLQTATLVKVSSNITGELLSLTVKEGDFVHRGQVLGQIDRRRYDALYRSHLASIRAAEGDVRVQQSQEARMQAELGRLRKLRAQNLAADADVQTAETNLATNAAQIATARERAQQASAIAESARTDLAQTTLVSPIDGTVLELSHRVGERVRGSDFQEDVVMLLGSLTAMEVKAEVGEHEVVHIKEGQRSTVEIDAIPDREMHGVVVEVGKNAIVKNPGTDAEVTTFPVRVSLTDAPPEALPGMSAQVSVETESHDGAITVPVQSVTVREATPKKQETGTLPASTSKGKLIKVVFVAKDGKAVQRAVRLGIAGRSAVEILEGLSAGEQVVEGPYRVLARELKDGDAVTQKKEVGG